MTTTFKIIALPGRRRLTTRGLNKLAYEQGWQLYRPDDVECAETMNEYSKLLVDTYAGEVLFTNTGNDNWGSFSPVHERHDKVTLVLDALVDLGFPVIEIDGTIH